MYILKIFHLGFLLCTQTGFACKLLAQFELQSILKEGDILIGGIFPLYSKQENIVYSFNRKPQMAECDGFGLQAYQWMRTMLFAVDEINQDDRLLPNISLGYIILDSCSSPTKVLRAALTLMSTSQQNGSQCNPPPILALIGESGSTQSLVVAGAVGPFKIPMVSYFSTCACLSDKTKYPTFFRTIPSDYYQAKALAFLVRQYGWTWIGVIMSDNDYGLNGISAFRKEVEAHGVCIAFVGTVLRTYPQSKILEAVELIKHSTVKVILAFAPERDIDPLMKEVLKQNITGIQWIGTESWVTAASLSTPEIFKYFGGTIGLMVRKMDIPKLGPVLKDISPYKDSESSFVSDFWEALVGCRPPSKSNYSSIATKICSGKEDVDYTNNFFDVSQLRVSYNVYQGVYAVAHALHQGMFCERPESNVSGLCLNASQLTPNLVTEQLKKVRFVDAFGELVFFDKNGDPPASYEVINWQLRDGQVQHIPVGHFSTSANGQYVLVINEDKIVWSTGNLTPKAVCSEICPQGTRKAHIKGLPLCCFDCIPCADGSISNTTGATDCITCPEEYWSNERKDSCIMKIIEFLSYTETMGIILMTLSLFGACLTCSTMVVFIHLRHTPLVKANNSELSLLLLLSLIFCFLCPLTFIGEPTVWSCMLRHTAFGIAFALCISCMLGKTIVVVTAFRATLPGNNMAAKFGPPQQRAIVCSCTAVQILICILWLNVAPPFPDRVIEQRSKKIILECNTGSDAAFYAVLGYIGLLAIVCLVLAFLARKLPDNFNEAKFITFSLLIFCAVWITFIPAYVSSPGKYTVAVEIFAILSSAFGLLICIFVPKCYIILIKPERNTRKHVMGNTPKKLLIYWDFHARHRAPLLTAKNRKLRLQFTQAHQNWSIEDWKNVTWSDESRLLLRHLDGRSPDLSPIEHLWDVVEREIRIMDVQPTNLQQLRDAIMSIWSKISEECFQYLVESMPRRIKAVLKAEEYNLSAGTHCSGHAVRFQYGAFSISSVDNWSQLCNK
ncbi:vomeronasal type-2 receptor 1-like [Tachysurus fulvidraco]|uniref:vomeronasal type-2 receptor 1-like n=1 Tax=Tachysurus fulvidraco TaxID=1234273 RepID=UPI001FED2D18|nr:vomeronasal type-2 receptor 1-like [Tachysurus fulvidraco]